MTHWLTTRVRLPHICSGPPAARAARRGGARARAASRGAGRDKCVGWTDCQGLAIERVQRRRAGGSAAYQYYIVLLLRCTVERECQKRDGLRRPETARGPGMR
jgi:hypothetical protein